MKIRMAQPADSEIVSDLVTSLLIELEPELTDEIKQTPFKKIFQGLVKKNKVWVFLAFDETQVPIGIITLHECAALYAGGVFGEISEFYVKPEFRSDKVGRKLLDAAEHFGIERKWKRLEVGTPEPEKWERSLNFYMSCGFSITGPRLKRIIKK